MSVPAWLRNWAGILLLAALFWGALSAVTLALEIGRPFAGFASYSITLEEWGRVAEESPSWWTIRRLLGDDLRGKFTTIDGLPFTRHVDAVFRQSAPGDIHAVTFIRENTGQEITLALAARSFSFYDFLDLKLPELIVAASFWILGAVVLRAAPDQPTNRVFAGLVACIAAHRLLTTNVIFADNRWWPNILTSVQLVFSAGLIGTAFHFAWLYPTPLPRRPMKLIFLFYVLAAVTAGVLIIGRSPWWPPGIEPPNSFLRELAFPVLLYLYLVSLAAIFIRILYSSLQPHKTRREKRILLLTALGMLVALPVLLALAGEVIPGVEHNLHWRSIDLRYLLLGIPLTLSLAIIRYQNLTVPPPAFLFVVVLAASALLASIAATLWAAVSPGIYYGGRPAFLPFFVLIFGASVFWSMQTTWQGWFGRFLQRERLNYEASRNVGRRLQTPTDPRTLPQALAEAINDELGLNVTAVWLANREEQVFKLAGRAGEAGALLPENVALAHGQPGRGPWRLAPGQPLPEWLAPLVSSPLEIASPLHHDGEFVALLGFGRRWDEEIFDEQDIVVLDLVAQQALLYLQVAQQIEVLRQVPQQISAAQERERTLLAAELHDTIQQFLGRLPFFLVASKEAMVDDPQEAAELLERSLRDIENAAQTVQGIRQNLAPSQLERSLARSLSALAAHTEQRNGLAVRLNVSGDVDAATDLESRHAIYRVIQHALDNAILHANAAQVDVTVQQQDGRVNFTVRDDGRGATPEELWLARSLGHFGLQSMQARVEACGGEFFFNTEHGNGTQVTGWVPAAGGEQR
ncbi:MAG: GAF domain-containing sensor histidine kinase [Candidatus Promineifilaceae bacterium]